MELKVLLGNDLRNIFSKHCKECSLVQVAVSNELNHPLPMHRSIIQSYPSLLSILLSKLLLPTHSIRTVRASKDNFRPQLSFYICVRNANWFSTWLCLSHICILCTITAMNFLAFSHFSARLLQASFSNSVQLEDIA